MYFPLSLSDISLWLAATAIVLLVTSELLNSVAEHSARVLVDRKMLRLVAIGVGLAFLATVVVRIFQPF